MDIRGAREHQMEVMEELNMGDVWLSAERGGNAKGCHQENPHGFTRSGRKADRIQVSKSLVSLIERLSSIPVALPLAEGSGGQPRREENCSARGGGGGTEAHFPNPPPSLAAVTGGGGGGNPTSMAQNDTHVTLIMLTTQMWGGGGGDYGWKIFFGPKFLFLRLRHQHPFLHKTKGPTRNPISPTPPPPSSAGVHVTPPPPPRRAIFRSP